MGISSILNYLGSFKGAKNALRGKDFFCFTGLGCSPAFRLDLKNCGGLNTAYKRCSPLATVISRNAMSLANGNVYVVDQDDNELKKYKWVISLLNEPNPIQTKTEFLFQLDTYRQLYGEVFVIKNIPVGFSEPTSLWVINPEYIDIDLTGKLYNQSNIADIVKKYSLLTPKGKVEIDQENILHIKDVYQNIDFCHTNIRGFSRVVGLEDHINNIIIASEAIYSLNKDRGAQGILSNENKDPMGSIPMTPVEKKELHDEMQDQYGLLKGQWKVILSQFPLRWQSMTFNAKDLQLFEGLQENIKRIADAFGYPYELLATAQGATFNNKKEAKKLHYQDTIIPMSLLYGEKLSKFLGIEEGKLILDYSHVEALKEAEKDKASTISTLTNAYKVLYELNVVTLEEVRLALNYNTQFTGNTFYGNKRTTSAEEAKVSSNTNS